jgi:biopolymer transport protein ExbB
MGRGMYFHKSATTSRYRALNIEGSLGLRLSVLWELAAKICAVRFESARHGLSRMKRQVVMRSVTVNRGNRMTIARVAAAAGLMLGVTLMVATAWAQPATQPSPQPAPGATAPATPPADPAAAPAPGTEPAPPEIGPDGMPVTPTTDPAATAPAPTDPAAAAAEEPAGPSITPIKMFLEASIVVKVVMILLMAWSVVTWALMFSKLAFFSGLNGTTNRFLAAFRSAGSLTDAAKSAGRNFRNNALAKMLVAAADEIGTGKKGGLSSRVAQRMGIVQNEVGEELSSGMGIFATVGSIAAFVGLFGTVWGIMNSFIGIAEKQTTNLAIVAPGIAEALFATGIGLFAAVPAVIFYNMFARRIGAYQTRMDNFASEVLVRVARDHE